MGVGDTFGEAFAKAQLGANEILPTSGTVVISVREDDKRFVAQIARDDSVDLTREVFDTIEPYLRATVDDGVHGSPNSVANWGLRGLYADDLGECNTWVVPSADVD